MILNGFPELMISNPKPVKLSISRVLSDLYIQEWNEKVNASSKGKQNIL